MKQQNIKVELLEVNTGQLDGLPTNPRLIKDHRFEALKKSITDAPEMLGLRELLVYPLDNGNYIVIGGNMRLEACRALGYTELPCKVIDKDVPVAKLREYTIKDNIAFGDTDWDILANQWDEVELADWGMEGMPDWGVDVDVEAQVKEAEEDDFDEAKDDIPQRVQAGEVWRLGEHRLYCGDSTSMTDVQKLLDNVKPSMIFTDPPYGMGLNQDYSSMSYGDRKGKKYEDAGLVDAFKPEMIKLIFDLDVKETFLWGADYFSEYLLNKNDGAWIVWDKTLESNGDAGNNSEFELCWSRQHHKREVIHFNWFRYFGLSKQDQMAKKRIHPTQKPLQVIHPFLNKYSKEGDTVLDLFGGSGSTLIACEQLGRRCRMMELDPHYCDVILARWEKLTGKQAEKIE